MLTLQVQNGDTYGPQTNAYFIPFPIPANTPYYELIARAVSLTPVTDATAKAAVALRESLAAPAIEVCFPGGE